MSTLLYKASQTDEVTADYDYMDPTATSENTCQLLLFFDGPVQILLESSEKNFTAKCGYGFYPRDAMLARVIAIATCPSVRPSVCLSRAGIVSKRRKLAS